jgi:hypothetical protein
MPVGVEVTVPEPAPDRSTVSVCKIGVNVAVTVVAALIVTWQVLVPVQPPPLHPANSEPAVGAAVKVTRVPASYCALHVEPQLMPVGVEVTPPEPRPALFTVSVNWRSVKVAVTSVAPVTVTVHIPVPEQPPPLQPPKVESAAALAVRVTEVAGG